jgi:hypothetical protein
MRTASDVATYFQGVGPSGPTKENGAKRLPLRSPPAASLQNLLKAPEALAGIAGKNGCSGPPRLSGEFSRRSANISSSGADTREPQQGDLPWLSPLFSQS